MSSTIQSAQGNQLRAGERVAKFKLEQRIGAGGFGEVWRAQEEIEGQTVGKPCAIKLMRFDTSGAGSGANESFKATWVQEINALKSILHDSIPRTIDGGVDDQTKLAFIAMELLHGETLAERIKRKRVGWRRALLIAERIASALDEAHKHDVVHRDLKPQNVFLGNDGRVWVIDWGIARLGRAPVEPIAIPTNPIVQGAAAVETMDMSSREHEELARKHLAKSAEKRQQLVGTPGYIAPEVYDGGDPAAPVDAYALGVVLYQCITGRLPYRATDASGTTGSDGNGRDEARALAATLWEATVGGNLIPIEEWVPDLPIGVRNLVNGLLSRDPQLRGAKELAKRVAHAHRFPHGVPDPPYAGLDPFGAERAGFLFGRDAHVERIVNRLKDQRALVLSGPSGCGKSSLAVAGVAARIDRELLEGTDGWRLFVVRPSQPKALEVVSPNATNEGESKDAPLGTMVVVDQLEEVLNLDADRQQMFCSGLAELSAAKRVKDVLVREHARITPEMPIRVVATVREDFEWQVVRIEALRELCESSRCLVTGVDATSARELVEEPAKALGYRLGDLQAVREVETLLAKDGTALPIVQFALTEWWTRRDESKKELPAKAWRELGGVEGALSYVADRHYRKLSDADQQALRDLFGRLLLGDRKQWVSTAVLASEMERRLMDELADLRLVRRRDDGEGGVGYELAHESLAKRWDVLKQWISERAAEDALIVDLEADARLWVRQGRPVNRLRLDMVVAPAVRARLGSDALAYVDASMEAKQAAETAAQEAKRTAEIFAQLERRRRYGFVIAALVAVLAGVAGYAVQIRQKEQDKSAALEAAKREKAEADKARKDAEQAREKAEAAEARVKTWALQVNELRKEVEAERNKRKADYDALEKRIAEAKSVKELEEIRQDITRQRAAAAKAQTIPDPVATGSPANPAIVEVPW